MRMGEEIAEGEWEAFSELEQELTTTVRGLMSSARNGTEPDADEATS
jgi:V/A-type H+-transporting ATPase subunit A